MLKCHVLISRRTATDGQNKPNMVPAAMDEHTPPPQHMIEAKRWSHIRLILQPVSVTHAALSEVICALTLMRLTTQPFVEP